MRIARFVVPALYVSMLALGGCTAKDTLAPAVPTSLTVTALAPTVLVGGSTGVRATAVANNQSVATSGTVWSSSAPSTATVSADGTVTGIARGTAQIRGTLGTVSASVGITVLGVRSLALQAPRSTLYPTQTILLTAQLDVDPGVSPTVQWSSSNATVATVTSSGVVTAVAPGTVNVSATLLGQSAAVTLTVLAVPVSVVSVTPATATLIAGGTQQLTASARDSAGTVLTGRPVTWSTNAPTVATVSATGLVTAVGPGTATITATSEGKSATAAITVLPPIATVSVTLGSSSVGIGQTVNATVALRDAAGNLLTGRQVTWGTTNPTIATVSSETGIITGVAAGAATITATSEGKIGSATIAVMPPVASITMTPAISGLAIGRTRALNATPIDGNGAAMTGIAVTWQSSNAAVATVSTSGVVTAVSVGQVSITATARGTIGSATLYIGRDYSSQNLAGTRVLRESDNRGASFALSNLTSTEMISGDFRYADFNGATLNGVQMHSANFFGANLTNTTWVEAVVNQQTIWPTGFDPRGKGMWGPDQDYSGQDLSAKRFRWYDFTRSKFIGAKLIGTELLNVSFVGADLTSANLSFADVRSASLAGATLTGTTWTEAVYDTQTQWPAGFSPLGKGMFGPNENYAGRNFSGRSFSYFDFSGANFSGANLMGCSMNIAVLGRTNFSSANLINVLFDGSDLRGAILNGATMTGAIIGSARLTGATYNSATIWPAGFDPVAAGAIRQ